MSKGNKWGVNQEQAKVLEELERILGKSIPQINIINWNIFGAKIDGDKIIGLGLCNCGLTVLPESFGDLRSLQTLEIWRNKLTTLPESILELKSLQILGLGGNKLRTLPESLLDISNLKNLYIQYNPLSSNAKIILKKLRKKGVKINR